MTVQGRAGWLAVSAALVLGLIALAGQGWLHEHDARLKAESLVSGQQQRIDEINKQVAATQQALSGQIAGIERERSRPATAAQVVSEARALIPNLPEEVKVEEVPSALPNGPSAATIVVPEADFQAVRDAQLTCEENTARLNACQSVQSDAKQQAALLTAERDEWKTAAKGGSVWHRALGAAKWFAVGAASGAVIYAVERHK
jgi:hypothetical protein